MAILEILSEPDLRLRTKAKKVQVVDDELRKFVDDMIETMYHDNGIGLAATQVNFHKSVLVIDLQDSDDEGRTRGFFPLCMINTKILELSEEKVVYPEGCLSVPEQSVEVLRPKGIVAEYLDREGKCCIIKSEGLLARVIQHEFDHLNGKLIIDYLSPLKKSIAIKKLVKLKKNKVFKL